MLIFELFSLIEFVIYNAIDITIVIVIAIEIVIEIVIDIVIKIIFLSIKQLKILKSLIKFYICEN